MLQPRGHARRRARRAERDAGGVPDGLGRLREGSTPDEQMGAPPVATHTRVRRVAPRAAGGLPSSRECSRTSSATCTCTCRARPELSPTVSEATACATVRRPIPTVRSREEYYTLKHQKWNKSLKRAVACFTYSWSGKEWGGYVGQYPTGNNGEYNPESPRCCRARAAAERKRDRYCGGSARLTQFDPSRERPGGLIFCLHTHTTAKAVHLTNTLAVVGRSLTVSRV